MPDPATSQSQPTVVLVHGALTDASVWNGVIERLQSRGLTTVAPALPLRDLAGDADYLAAFLDTVEGPVVLAGHSYGGSVISHPRLDRDGVGALVFVAAFAPDSGESTGELNGRFSGSKLGEATTEVRPYPGGQDLYLRRADFAAVYAADLPAAVTDRMAAAQRPIDPAALEETFEGAPSWRRIPTWTVLTTNDDSLPAEAQRFMAERADSTVVELAASHAVPASRPREVAEVISAVAERIGTTAEVAR